METEKGLIYTLIVIFLIIILVSANWIPIWIIKKRAKKYGFDINVKNTKLLIKMGCVNASFFLECSRFIQNKLDMDIIKLGYHQIAGGNLENVLDGLLYAKDNYISISYSEICALDLAKKNIVETLKKGCSNRQMD